LPNPFWQVELVILSENENRLFKRKIRKPIIIFVSCQKGSVPYFLLYYHCLCFFTGILYLRFYGLRAGMFHHVPNIC